LFSQYAQQLLLEGCRILLGRRTGALLSILSWWSAFVRGLLRDIARLRRSGLVG
jgi:hypothetical protein